MCSIFSFVFKKISDTSGIGGQEWGRVMCFEESRYLSRLIYNRTELVEARNHGRESGDLLDGVPGKPGGSHAEGSGPAYLETRK